MAGEAAYSSGPQRKPTIQRIDLAPTAVLTLEVGADGVCLITIEGPLPHDSAFMLHRALHVNVTPQDITGLVVDVRYSPALSIVRLGNLVEMLREFRVPLAVLLSNEGQRQVASLLHNTLTADAAYFTDLEAAVTFARGTSPPRFPTTM